MRSVKWLVAVLMFGFAPPGSHAQDAPPAPPEPVPAEVPPPPAGDPQFESPPVQGGPAEPRVGKQRLSTPRRLPPDVSGGPGGLPPVAPPGPAPAEVPAVPVLERIPYEEVLFYHPRPLGGPVKGSYLGVGTSSPPEALRRQLQLKPGLGLVVDHVEAGSPAEQAGVKEFDVLQKLDDQLLVNPEQLLVLVRTYKAGDEVKLTVIREGEPQVLTAKLVEREVPPVRLLTRTQPYTTDLRPAHAPDNLNFTNVRLLTAVEASAAERNTDLLFDGRGNRIEAASIVIEDGAHRMSINSEDGKKHLRVEDEAGKIIFDGPIHTAEELGQVPTDVRDKIFKMGLQGLALPDKPGSDDQTKSPGETVGQPLPAGTGDPGEGGAPRPAQPGVGER